jgi:hypothetical protein
VLNGQVCAKARAHSFTTGTDPLEEPAPIIQGKVWAPAEPCHTLPLYGRGPRVHESTRALGPWGWLSAASASQSSRVGRGAAAPAVMGARLETSRRKPLFPWGPLQFPLAALHEPRGLGVCTSKLLAS